MNFISRTQMLDDIAEERNIDRSTKKGLLELISIVVDYEDDMHSFLEDTLMMLGESTEKAWEDIAKEGV